MTEFDVTADNSLIMFDPASVELEVIQNVRTIIGTAKGSVPLDRNFGLDQSVVDKPLPIARAMVSRDVVEAIRTYEPRAKVIRVTFNDITEAIDGKLKPIVRISING